MKRSFKILAVNVAIEVEEMNFQNAIGLLLLTVGR